MAEQGRNKPRKTGKKRTSPSLTERIKKAQKAYEENVNETLKSLGPEEMPINESTNLFTAVPKGIYRFGKGNLKGIKNVGSALLGFEKGGQVRAMKNGGAVMKGRGPKFKGQS
jgi:hypothetical protein